MKTEARPLFIVFEGIDGSGKSTQLARLSDRLTAVGIPHSCHHEPTDGPVGRLLRRALSKEIQLDELTLALLFAADRSEHALRVQEELAAGRTVLCDRHLLSSLAYNAPDLDGQWVHSINRPIRNRVRPDVTFLFDLPVEEALARISSRSERRDHYEKWDVLQQVRDRYLYWADQLADPILRLDASRPIDSQTESLVQYLKDQHHMPL
ncbi:dTMP kinase [Peptococcus simiae]|uniref:dTMP kinase n=1 Tax=Peptococcus simiae TaxID=1643805 RepID=UPI0039800501